MLTRHASIAGLLAAAALFSAARAGLPPNRGRQLFLWLEDRGTVVAMDEPIRAVYQGWHRDYPTYDFIYAAVKQTESGCTVHFTRHVMGEDYSPRQEELDLVFPYAEQLRCRFFGHEHIAGFYRYSVDDIDPREFMSPPKTSNQAMQRTAGRSAFPLSMTSTFNQQPRALSPAVADLVSR